MAQLPNSTSPAKRLMFVLMGGVGLVLLGGGGVILGLNSKLTTLQTTAQQKDAEVADSEQITRRYQTTLDDYNDTQSRIKFLETAVSSKSYVPTLLQQIQTLAGQTHLTVTSVRPEMAPPPPPPVRSPEGTAPATDAKKVAPPPYDVINVNIDVIGTYADTSTFLYSLTRFPKIISLSSAQMHPNTAPPAAPGAAAAAPAATVTTNLKLVAFMFHDDDAPDVAPTQAVTAAITPNSGLPYTTVPPASVGTISAAAGRAAVGAAAATRAANARSAASVSSL